MSAGPSTPLGRVVRSENFSVGQSRPLGQVVPWAESSLGPSRPLGRVVPWAKLSFGPSRPLDQVVLGRVVLGRVVPWTGLSAGPSCPLGQVVLEPSPSSPATFIRPAERSPYKYKRYCTNASTRIHEYRNQENVVQLCAEVGTRTPLSSLHTLAFLLRDR